MDLLVSHWSSGCSGLVLCVCVSVMWFLTARLSMHFQDPSADEPGKVNTIKLSYVPQKRRASAEKKEEKEKKNRKDSKENKEKEEELARVRAFGRIDCKGRPLVGVGECTIE